MSSIAYSIKPVYDKATTYCVQYTATNELEGLKLGNDCNAQISVSVNTMQVLNTPVVVKWAIKFNSDSSYPFRTYIPSESYNKDLSSTIQGCLWSAGCTLNNQAERIVMKNVKNMQGNKDLVSFQYTIPASSLSKTGDYGFLVNSTFVNGFSTMQSATYFQLKIVIDSASAAMKSDATETNCWASPVSADVETLQVAESRGSQGVGSTCPVGIKFDAINKASVSENFSVKWTAQYDTSTSTPKIANLYSVPLNSSTNILSSKTSFTDLKISQAGLYYCKQSSQCTPFSGDSKLLNTPVGVTIDNSGKAQFAANDISIDEAGDYFVFAHFASPTSGSSRIDTVRFTTIEVSKNQTALIGGLCGGIGFLVILILLFCCLRRRKQRLLRKNMDFTQDGQFLRQSQGGAPSSKHTVQSSRTKGSRKAADVISLRSQNVGSQFSEQQIRPNRANSDDSLSFDPYSRPSFVEIGENGHYSMNSRSDYSSSAHTSDFSSYTIDTDSFNMKNPTYQDNSAFHQQPRVHMNGGNRSNMQFTERHGQNVPESEYSNGASSHNYNPSRNGIRFYNGNNPNNSNNRFVRDNEIIGENDVYEGPELNHSQFVYQK